MLEKELFEHYGLYTEEIMYIGSDMVIISKGRIYLVRPINNHTIKTLEEKRSMAQWLTYYGENNLAHLLVKRDGQLYFKMEHENYMVFEGSHIHTREKQSLGKRLAQFHEKGFHYLRDEKGIGRFIPWKERWERRMDQLEGWYVHISRKKNKTKIDECFCLTFPYYLGVSENAIQMMADIFIDDDPANFYQYRTICHHRFRDQTWLTLAEDVVSSVKILTDFTYDHYVRDISDYIRTLWLEGDHDSRATMEQISGFLNEYESVRALTFYDQKLLFARLLFPLHYFEKVEQYYDLSDDDKKKTEVEWERIFTLHEEDEWILQYILLRYPNLKQEVGLPHWLLNEKKGKL